MKKITIIFMLVLMIFTSCSMDTSYDDSNEIEEKTNTEKEDDTENNTEKPSNEEPKEDEPSNEEDNSENDNDEEGNSENTEIVEDESSNEKPKEDDTENNTEKPSNEEDDTENNTEKPSNEEPKEDDFENEVVEDKTWCEISEDTKILGLNYFVCVDNSQKKLSPSINDESQAKKDTFLIRDYVSKYIEIRVGYNDKKLNFSSVNDSYTITNVMKKDSIINITIKWKQTIKLPQK